MARIRISSICALWPWPLRYDLGSKSWHTLGLWRTIVWYIIQIQLDSEELLPRHGFWVCVHCDLDLGNMTLSKSHDTPLGHGKQLCEILSRSNLAVRSYDLDLWDMSLGQGHDIPLSHGQQLCEIISRSDKGVRSYCPDTMWTDGQTDRRTDRRTRWFLYTPKLCLRGYN